ncbi:MAG: carboxypeptidase regulatory-like domain-containing protein [Bryobacteraceae bacterium]
MGVVLFLLLSCSLLAQTTTGSIVGNITDGQNLPVANASVKAVNEATGFQRQGTTAQSGEYVLPLLPIGNYRVEVEAAGFASGIASQIPLELDRVVRVNLSLKPSTVVEKVEVTAPPPLVETETGARGAVIENKRIVDLPLNGRQFLELAKLTPGVVQNAGGSLRSELTGNLAGPNITVYGARESDNYYSIDGISANDRFYNSPTVLPSIDAIQEFKVQSSSYAAEAGGQGGANINLSIKSGTDQFHGSAFEFFRNSRLDARNSFDLIDKNGDRKADIPPFQQNQFGVSLGGPIEKSKTFFFGSYEGLRVRKSITQLQTLPTVAMRAGDFREIPGVRVLDPFTGQPFATPNVVPQQRVDPTARAALSLLPLPNLPGFSQNYIAQPKEENTTNQFVARVDRNYSERDRVYGRFIGANAKGFLPFGTRSVLGTVRSAVPGFGNFLTLNSRNAVVGWTRAFSPRLLGELRLGYNRVSGGQFPQNAGNNFAREQKLQGIPDLAADQRGYPRFFVVGYPEFGDIEFTITRRNNEYSGEYQLTGITGRHTWKMGGFYRRVQFAPNSYQIPRGQYQFGAGTTGPFSGMPFADFLLGHPDTFNLAEIDEAYMFGNEYAAFAQTDWRVARGLTFNFGVRYEFFGSLYEKYDRIATFDPDRKVFIVPSQGGKTANPIFVSNAAGFSATAISVRNPAGTFTYPVKTTEELGLPRGILANDRNNFAPRFGFAWDPSANGRMVVRGGYGIFYSRPMYSTRAQLSTQPPYSNRIQVQFASAGTPARPTTIAGAGAEIPASPVINISQFPKVDFRTGYVQQWNFTVERALPGNMTLSAAYVGSKGTKLFSNRLYNYPRPGAEPGGTTPANRGANANIGIPGQGGFTGGPPPEIAVQGPAFLRFNNLPEAPGVFYSFLMNDSGFSTYHSGSLRLQKRFTRGLTFDTSYNWAKSIDNDSLGIPINDASASDQNPFNKGPEKARSAFDVRHRLVGSFAYELPLGKHWLAREWQVGGILMFETGLPFSVNLIGDYYGIGSSRRGRPDLAGDPNNGPKTVNQWFKTSAFVLPPVAVTSFPFLFIPGPDFVRRMPTPLGNFGNAGRNIVNADGLATGNFSLLKNFRITERTALQFRAEVFNLTNHPEYSFPNRDFIVPSATTILNPAWDRHTQNPDFGKISSTRIDSRQIQFGLKLLW